MISESTTSVYDSFAYWLTCIAGAMSLRLDQALAEHGVTFAQWAVLASIGLDGARRPGEVARLLRIDGSAITRHLDRLETKGLLQREADGADRRALQLVLTPAGSRAVRELSRKVNEIERGLLTGLSDQETDSMDALFGHWLRNLGLSYVPMQREDGRP